MNNTGVNQGIYCYRAEPFSLRRVLTLIPVRKENFDRVERQYDNAVASAHKILDLAHRWKSQHDNYDGLVIIKAYNHDQESHIRLWQGIGRLRFPPYHSHLFQDRRGPEGV